MLVLLASINFLFDPKDTNRSCMLVALLLVLATIFSMAQVYTKLSYARMSELHRDLNEFETAFAKF